jgi:sulfate/thiosulfate transport system ATP-binding protein
VKLALTLPSGETVTVEMPAHEFDALHVTPGDRVFVDIRAAKVFVGDYAI